LRALQDREVLPVGATRTVAVDVRVVAATNRALAAAVDDGGFRRDLYARLAMWEIAVPPLRARRADIMDWLARLHRVWLEARPGAGAVPIELLPDAVETILLHPWPDNLRGLDRLVHLLATAPRTSAIARADLPAWLREPPSQTAPTVPGRVRREAPARADFERAYHELGGSVRALARHFGRDRKQIYRWLTAFGLKKADDEPGED
jgi:transcriptional regulator of acetoin/glycerol metabolism